MFEIGSLVIAKDGTSYGRTDTYSLMVVERNNGYGEIRVKVIASDSHDHFSNWTVEESDFKEITIEEYFNKFPDADKCDDFDEIVESYGYKCNNTNELTAYPNPDEPFVLSDKMREELVKEMKQLYLKYDYAPTDEGINKQLDEWAKNKGNLIKWMEKHPKYNGKFQIAFESDFDREINKEAIYNFFGWVMGTLCKREIKVGNFTYSECSDIASKLQRIINVFDYEDTIKTINGEPRFYYLEEKRKFENYMVKIDTSYSWNGYIIDKETYDIIRSIDNIDDYFRYNKINNTASQEFVRKINKYFPSLKATEGQKVSRIINKLCGLIGINKEKDYNKEFAKFSDAINPLKIKRHTVLSCHPVDYLTMSFGNSWGSCHTIDKKNKRHMDNSYHGAYSGGTLSYMLDGTSAVFYTVDASYNGNNLELQPKINRNMFHIGEYKVVQGRLYPQSNDDNNEFYTDIRNIVQKVIADCWGKANMWTLKKGIDECCRVITSYGSHYKDYANYDLCNVSYLKLDNDMVNKKKIIVGHNSICPNCGDEHTWEESVECIHCYDKDRDNSKMFEEDEDILLEAC